MQREPQPVKLYTQARMYRYATPQKGRYREHWQQSVEAIGSDDPAIDAEVIQLYVEVLRRLGVKQWELQLNSIGDANCRPAYVEKLVEWLDANDSSLDDEARQKRATARSASSTSRARASVRRSPTRRRSANRSATPASSTSPKCAAISMRSACRTPLEPTLVRGLDYYTRTTFEFVGPEEGAQSTICAGGRYDGLIEELGGPPTPGIGFGAGVERLLQALEHEGITAAASRARPLLRDRARARIALPRSPSSPSCARRRLVRRRLRRALAQGSAHAARAFGRARVRARSRGRRDDQARRRRAGRARREGRGYGARVNEWRDTYCGDVTADDVGKRLTLAGWTARRRDHGGLVFIDLRDHTGLVQLVVNPDRAPEAAAVAHDVRSEFVLRARGEVVPRAPDAVNPNLPTGAIEVQVDELEIVSRSDPLPFQLDEENVDENVRLRYRYLDLRRERMQRNMRLSANVIASIRRTMDEQGFIDVWTPSMTRGTPEGARDFLVPVRLQPGKFFALAQSPQLFKQLFMVGGLDRYYQIATCWRDEDLRADRQFEFRQLDLELAFPVREDVLDVLERVVVAAFEASGKTPPARPFPRLAYAESMLRYGTDKPDVRFGLEIQDATEITRGSEFGVFAGAPVVRYLVAPRAFSRAELGRLEEFAKEWGAKGLAYLVVDESGEVRSPIAKFLSEQELEAFRAPPGSTVLFVADSEPMVERVLGALRSHLGAELGLIDDTQEAFLWVLDFPLFLHDEDTGQWTFVHHPFTAPMPEHEDRIESDPGSALSQHYDLIWNGWELGSGSIRIHRREVQERVFRAMGMSDEEAQAKFGWFLNALRMGAPPHGGFALGIERFVALMAGESNIREVIAYPKTASGSDPLTGAPTPIPQEVLSELGIKVTTDPI